MLRHTHSLELRVCEHPVTRPSLLIVDDDALIREGLAIAFDTDFSVYQADSRAAAIALLRGLSSPPQLALIDLGLPPYPTGQTKVFS